MNNTPCNRLLLAASILYYATTAFAGFSFADDSGGNNVNGVGAIAGTGNQNTAIGVSVQIINGSENQVSGIGAAAQQGNGNTAIGVNSQIISGNENQAIGYGAAAGGGDYNTAIGQYSYSVQGSANTAVGSMAYAGGSDSFISTGNTAVGYGAAAMAGNSVAIGAFSVADRANTVSVGQPGYERQITNVAPGVYDTDAVNMSQLRNVGDRVNRVGAMAIAFSSLAPMSYDPQEPTQISAGIGTYDGSTAIAVGVYHYTHPDVMLNAAFAFSSNGWEKAARFGATWRIGSKHHKPSLNLQTSTATNVPAASTKPTAATPEITKPETTKTEATKPETTNSETPQTGTTEQ